MELPYRFHVQAAQRCAQLLGEDRTSRHQVDSAYRQAVTDGLFPTGALREGESLLARIGLITYEDGWVIPTDAIRALEGLDDDEATELTILKLFEIELPTWFWTSVSSDAVTTEFIPQQDLTSLERLIPDPERREAMLLRFARKFDAERATSDGDRGERHVVKECKRILSEAGLEHLSSQVRQLSLESDQLGYDVRSPSTSGSTVRLEVKTTRRRNPLKVFLSRNEATVASNDNCWYLVVCLIYGDEDKVLGYCQHPDFADQLPVDSPPGHWESCKISMDSLALVDGLPL